MDALQQMLEGQSGNGQPQDPLQAMLMQQAQAPKAMSQSTGTQDIEGTAQTFAQRLKADVADIPHQLGLTARHIIEGGGDTLNFIASPVRAGLNYILPKSAPSLSGLVAGNQPQDAIPAIDFQGMADRLGLPQPRNAFERVVGDASKMVVQGGGIAGIAGKASTVTNGIAQALAKLLASNPTQQLASAGAAGGAGGVVREAGGGPTSQFAASLAAGVGAPFAMTKGQQLASAIAGRFQPMQPAQVDASINNALRSNGVTLGDLPNHVQSGIRADVAQALKANPSLSPDAVRRLADYRLTNTTPTAATLTLDPAMVSQQQNLAKLGINSKDMAAQQLGQVQNANNRQLITGLNDLGANTPDSPLAAGQKIIDTLDAQNKGAQAVISRSYDTARSTAGRSISLDHSAFSNTANDLLDQHLLGGKLPSDVRNLLNKAATGQMPLTVDTAEQFKTRIGDLQRASNDASERKALGLVRQALDQTPLLSDGKGLGQDSIDAFNQARSLNRAWMGTVDKTPALRAVRDGLEPDKFMQQYVIGNGAKTNTSDLDALRNAVRSSPTAMTAIKQQIVAHLKNAALRQAADEVGNFSQSAYNKALGSIGDQKLNMFFSKDEVNQLRAIGRVSSYEQFQPSGSAVNNSNTSGSALATILDKIGNSPLLSKIPFGSSFAGPAQNIAVGMRSKRALNVPAALTRGQLLPGVKRPGGLLISPGVFMNGDDRKR